MISRRLLLACLASLAAVAGCATAASSQQDLPPIVFVHGNGDSASVWQATIWRFESNGWPRSRLVALDIPYPLARDDDAKPQPGRSSTAEQMAYLKAEVDKVIAQTGAGKVVLFGLSRGGPVARNYVDNGGGDRTVSHVVIGGGINHGLWSGTIDGLPAGSEFAGSGPYMTALNRPKNAAGDEVVGPVKWLTIRSDSNDKYAQPDGLWLGKRGVSTGVTYAAPELKGATNVVIPRIDHRETALSPASFAAAYRFITGKDPAVTAIKPEEKVVLGGRVTGLGVSSTDPASGNGANNLPVPGARVEIYAVDSNTGERLGAPAYAATVGVDGVWGPINASPTARYEFVLSAPSYATLHTYRSPFPRSSSIVHLRAERIADADKNAPAIVRMYRPRGYLDPGRDKMVFDGQSPPPGAVLGAGIATSTIKPAFDAPRAITAEFNGERVIGRTWPAKDGHVTTLELTY